MGSCLHQVKISTTAKDSVISTRMPNIKLTYFDLRARAEPCRLLLAYAGAKYEDERLPAPWDNVAPWAALKPNTPWGQVPLLAWDGEVIAQSMACARFLAREYNLAGRTSMEMAQVDEIIDVIQDLLNAWYSLYHAFSWADLHIFFYVTDMKLMANKDVDQNFPKIAKSVQRVGRIPNVKAWVESRPASVL